jgi:hypothetical protein
VASLYGFDALAYLALEARDLIMADAVLAERIKIEDERRQRELDYLSGRTASLITNWLAQSLK